MKLGVVILAHRNPEQVALLVDEFRDPRVWTYLHVDRRVSLEPFASRLRDTGAVRLTFLERYPTRWGGVELVDASVAGLRRAVEDGCGYVVLLSGQDRPLWPLDRIVGFFEAAGNRSYVEHTPLPRDRWPLGGRMRTDFYTFTVRGRRETCIPRGVDLSMSWKGRLLNWMLRLRTLGRPPRRFPPYLQPHGGSQWWNLSRAAAVYVLDFLAQHPDYRAYHEHTLIPDEIFFQSILAGSSFADRHELVDEDLRFTIWDPVASHPRVLRTEDLSLARESDKPFARKFDLDVDPDAVRRAAVGP